MRAQQAGQIFRPYLYETPQIIGTFVLWLGRNEEHKQKSYEQRTDYHYKHNCVRLYHHLNVVILQIMQGS